MLTILKSQAFDDWIAAWGGGSAPPVCGGTKKTQAADIKRAKEIAKMWQED